MRLVDADSLKICLQNHYGVIEQDCSISEKFADGAISGIDAATFEVDAAPTIDAIPVEWIKALTNHSDMFTRGAAKWVLGCWKKEQEAR